MGKKTGKKINIGPGPVSGGGGMATYQPDQTKPDYQPKLDLDEMLKLAEDGIKELTAELLESQNETQALAQVITMSENQAHKETLAVIEANQAYQEKISELVEMVIELEANVNNAQKSNNNNVMALGKSNLELVHTKQALAISTKTVDKLSLEALGKNKITKPAYNMSPLPPLEKLEKRLKQARNTMSRCTGMIDTCLGYEAGKIQGVEGSPVSLIYAEGLDNAVARLISHYVGDRTRVVKLSEGLSFYANPEHWTFPDDEPGEAAHHVFYLKDGNAAGGVGGTKARKILDLLLGGSLMAAHYKKVDHSPPPEMETKEVTKEVSMSFTVKKDGEEVTLMPNTAEFSVGGHHHAPQGVSGSPVVSGSTVNVDLDEVAGPGSLSIKLTKEEASPHPAALVVEKAMNALAQLLDPGHVARDPLVEELMLETLMADDEVTVENCVAKSINIGATMVTIMKEVVDEKTLALRIGDLKSEDTFKVFFTADGTIGKIEEAMNQAWLFPALTPPNLSDEF